MAATADSGTKYCPKSDEGVRSAVKAGAFAIALRLLALGAKCDEAFHTELRADGAWRALVLDEKAVALVGASDRGIVRCSLPAEK